MAIIRDSNSIFNDHIVGIRSSRQSLRGIRKTKDMFCSALGSFFRYNFKFKLAVDWMDRARAHGGRHAKARHSSYGFGAVGGFWTIAFDGAIDLWDILVLSFMAYLTYSLGATRPCRRNVILN